MCDGRFSSELVTLRAWSRDGVPSGQTPRRSLNGVRCWEDPELGISRIGSPGSFTTRHPEHGVAVKAIAEVLEVLVKRERETKSREPSFATQLKDERRLSVALKKMLQDAADLHAAMTVELEGALRDLRVTRQSLESVTARNSELLKEAQGLRCSLARYSDSELVTDINSRRTS